MKVRIVYDGADEKKGEFEHDVPNKYSRTPEQTEKYIKRLLNKLPGNRKLDTWFYIDDPYQG